MVWSGRNFVLFYLVPTIVCLVAARQAYLSKFQELSTWKGGGMGMFASADGADTRFLRVYIEKENGDREPVVNFTPAQQKQLERILWYPNRASIAPLARSLRQTTFVASNEGSAINRFSIKGEHLEKLEKKHYLLHANRTRTNREDPPWTLVCEYYRLRYDPETRVAHYVLSDSFRFGREGT